MKDYIILQISSIKEYFRDTEAIFWTLLFPLIFLLVFRLFDTSGAVNADIIVIDQADNQTTQSIIASLQNVDGIGINTSYTSIDQAKQDLSDSEEIEVTFVNDADEEVTENRTVDIVLVFPEEYSEFTNPQTAQVSTAQLFYNDADEGQASPSSIVESIIQDITSDITLQTFGGQELFAIDRQGIAVNEIGFYDFFVPGVIGLGLMQSGIIGISFSMANKKEKGIFKRLSATPLASWKFILSQVVTYLIISILQVSIMLVLALYMLDANIYGSIPLLYGLSVLASFIFLSIGFIIAATTKSANAASGLANVITIPMMFLSGVFFSREGFPEPIATISDYLPLSPVIDAMRDVALLEAGVADIQDELFVMAVWIVVAFAFAVRLFKFREE